MSTEYSEDRRAQQTSSNFMRDVLTLVGRDAHRTPDIPVRQKRK